LTVYLDAKGILLEFLDVRATLNADCYCTTLWHLKDVTSMKHLGLLVEEVILLHNKAHHHTATVTT
jgi:hypothetical protein